ncbi:MAG TPA: hypothetical protein VJJ46_05075, partial [Anaerolineales bacterium]|nr:hypothetical protein [Anaerolineales bacterium]
MTTLFGWMLDAYPAGDGMTIWLLDADGRPHALEDRLTPAFCARGPRQDLHALCQMFRARRAPVTLRRVERRDLFLDREVEVLEVGVRLPALFP